MAFLNRFGSLCRQNLSLNIASSGQAHLPSMLNAVRHMSDSRLFIGGLHYGVSSNSLKEAFSNFGNVIDARIITDRDTGMSKGFGFVSFSSEESANDALSMDRQEINGKSIRVQLASVRSSIERSSSGRTQK